MRLYGNDEITKAQHDRGMGIGDNLKFYSFSGCRGLATGLFMPIWVLYLADNGITLLQIGLLGSVLELFRIIFEVPSGSFSDRFGERLSVILSCLFGALSWSLFWLTGVEFSILLFSMFFLALSGSLFSGSFESWISKTVNVDGFAHVLSRSNQVMYSFFILGSVLSGHIYAYDNRWLFQGVTAVLLLSLIPVVLLPQPSSPKENSHPHSMWDAFINGVRFMRGTRIALVVAASTFFANMSYDTVERYWQPLLDSKGTSALAFGYIMALGGIVAVACLEIAKRVPERNGILTLGVMEMVSAALLILLILGSGESVILACVLLLAIGRSRATVEQIALNRSFPATYKATLFSLVAGAGALGELLAGVSLGLIVQYIGLGAGFGVCAILILISLASLAHYIVKSRTK